MYTHTYIYIYIYIHTYVSSAHSRWRVGLREVGVQVLKGVSGTAHLSPSAVFTSMSIRMANNHCHLSCCR